MSEVLKIVRHGDPPLRLVRCAGCLREYETVRSLAAIDRARRCAACKRSGFARAPRRWSRKPRVPRYWSRTPS